MFLELPTKVRFSFFIFFLLTNSVRFVFYKCDGADDRVACCDIENKTKDSRVADLRKTIFPVRSRG